MKTPHTITNGIAAGLAALALGATLPDLRAQQVSSSASVDLSAKPRGAGYPVYFALKLLENGKEAKAEGITENELRTDIRKWLGECAPNSAQDCLGLDAIAAYLAKIGNDPRYQPRGAKGWIRHEWINAEFEAYNARWAPLVYALDNRKDLDSTYRTQVAAFLAGQILENKIVTGLRADTTGLVSLINGLPMSSTCTVAPSKAVKKVAVGFGLEAGDNLGDYVQELYPSTAMDPDKRAKYGKILATLNPHAMQRTVGLHYVLKAGMTVVVPTEGFLASAL